MSTFLFFQDFLQNERMQTNWNYRSYWIYGRFFLKKTLFRLNLLFLQIFLQNLSQRNLLSFRELIQFWVIWVEIEKTPFYVPQWKTFSRYLWEEWVTELIEWTRPGVIKCNRVQWSEIDSPLMFAEFARIIKDLVGGTSKIIELAAVEDDPQRRRPDISRAKKYLSWEPKVPLDEGLKKTITYFAKELQRTKHSQKDIARKTFVNDHDIVEQLWAVFSLFFFFVFSKAFVPTNGAKVFERLVDIIERCNDASGWRSMEKWSPFCT